MILNQTIETENPTESKPKSTELQLAAEQWLKAYWYKHYGVFGVKKWNVFNWPANHMN